jgi:hypothetical protein
MGFTLLNQGQNLHYLIRLDNEQMGDMHASKTKGSKEKYLMESKIKVEKMIKVDLFYKIEAIFEKNILLLSNALETANGKEHTNSETIKNKSGYSVKTKKETKTIPHKGISYNLCKLYFEEPIGVNNIWSDTFGEMLTLKPAGEHRYELVLPNGKSSFYSYFKGICTLVETDFMFGKITFTLSK